MNEMKIGKALNAGPTGVVGRNLLEHLVERADWDVVTVARRKPDVDGDYQHVAIDLSNADDCHQKAMSLADVTHVFFAAYVESPDTKKWVVRNVAMLHNLVAAIEPVAEGLQHMRLSSTNCT